jgi:hypothetical protein
MAQRRARFGLGYLIFTVAVSLFIVGLAALLLGMKVGTWNWPLVLLGAVALGAAGWLALRVPPPGD